MKQLALCGTVIALAHMIVLFSHGAACSHLQIEPNLWQGLFIAIVLLADPVLAGLLLWTRWQRTGIALLGIWLGSSLLFGLYYHFIAGEIDSVFKPIHTHWGIWFRTIAVLFAFIEIVGCVWRLVLLRFSENSGLKAMES